MSFKLIKSESQQFATLTAILEERRTALENAVDAFNTTIDEAHVPVVEAVEAFNDALEETRQFVSDIANQGQSDFEERSERWQEGDRGQAAQEWWEAWQEAADSLTDVDVGIPEPISLDICDIDALSGLPEEADV